LAWELRSPLVVEALGGNLPALCAESGLDADVFFDHRNLVSVEAFARFLHLGALQMSSPSFGLFVGARLNLPSLGILGESMRVFETLSDALRVLDAHFQINTRGVRLRYQEDRDAGHLTFGLYEPLHQGNAQASTSRSQLPCKL
jgi:hypothetical protein